LAPALKGVDPRAKPGGDETQFGSYVAAMELPIDLPEFKAGHVWLVGAGPGEPGLLSLLALHALRNADIVVYDALVDERVLALARPEAEKEYAGKRGGRPSAKQPDISERLVALAKAGKRVLRLKGGDPFVFGRGADEALVLAAAKIPFRVVPGITAGVGGLAYAGIPATARGANVAVAFITGYDHRGAVPDSVDWGKLAGGIPVLVFYMALAHLDEIAQRLIAAGRSPDEPAAIVSRAATEHQRVVEAKLSEIAAAAKAAAIEPPAMLVVGEVVRLRSRLEWFRPDLT
jgi:uroporphyrin-III C-methyltransferase